MAAITTQSNKTALESVSAPAPLLLLQQAKAALDKGDQNQANHLVRTLLHTHPQTAYRIFRLVWEQSGRPTDRGANFGEDAFFGQNFHSIDLHKKVGILEMVIRENESPETTQTSLNPSIPIDCVFCNSSILDKQRVYTDGTYWDVLASVTPTTEGHLLVVPKNRHVRTFDALSPDEMAVLPSVIRKCKEAFQNQFGKEMHYLLIQKNGTYAGQSVHHVHFHIIPSDSINTTTESAQNVFKAKEHISPLMLAKQSAISKLAFLNADPRVIKALKEECPDLTLAPSLNNLAAKWRLEALLCVVSNPMEKEVIHELICKINHDPLPTPDNYYLHLEAIDGVLTTKKTPFIKHRDRHAHISPFSFNQVHLSSGISMNASQVKFPSPDESYAEAKTSYIAMSAPMPGYVLNTLQMYMEQNVKAVVNLTEFEEGAHVKADRYLPEKQGDIIQGDGYSLKNVKTTTIPLSVSWTLEEKVIEATIEEKTHTFTQFHVKGWKDFTDGDPEAVAQLTRIVAKHRAHSSGLVAVHCSGGVGRTGTFIATSEIFDRLTRGVPTEQISVREIAGQMRVQRWYLGGSKGQYQTVWKVKELLSRYK